MTTPVCPTNPVTPGKDVCNTCLINGCDNCVDRCIDSNDCSNSTRTQVKTLNNPNETNQVNFGSDPNFVGGSSTFAGNEFVCGIEPVDSSLRVNGAPVGVGDTVSLSYVGGSHSNGSFSVQSSLTDVAPTYPTGSQIQTEFDVKTPNESFVFLQDIYQDTFKNYVDFHNQRDDLAPIDFDFYSLRNLDSNSLANNLFNMVKSLYKVQMLDIQTSNFDRHTKQNELRNIRKEIDNHRAVIDNLKDVNATSKRNIEININKSRRLRDTNKVLMIVMIFVGLMVIVPIFKKFGLIPLSVALGIWCVLLLIVLGYMVYELYMKRANVDELEYKKRNFAKPTDSEIAKSRALAQMNDKDKARCQAFSELEQELDVPNIQLDVSQYYSSNATPDSCAHIPEE